MNLATGIKWGAAGKGRGGKWKRRLNFNYVNYLCLYLVTALTIWKSRMLEGLIFAHFKYSWHLKHLLSWAWWAEQALTSPALSSLSSISGCSAKTTDQSRKLTVKALLGPLRGLCWEPYWFQEGDGWMCSMSVSAIQAFWTGFACWHFTMTWVSAQALTQLLKSGRTAQRTRAEKWGGRRRKYLLSTAIIYHFQTVQQDKG